MKQVRLAFVGLGFVMAALPVQATVIDFTGHGDDGSNTIDHQGFRFTFEASGWGVFTDGFGGWPWNSNGTERLVAGGDLNAHGAQVDFKPIDNSTFSLQGFDTATLWTSFTSGQIWVVGFVHGGGNFSQLVDLTNSFQSVSLSNGFTNLDSVRVQSTVSGGWQQEPGFQLDNIEVNNPVPEPATMIALGAGLLGLSRRRRKSA